MTKKHPKWVLWLLTLALIITPLVGAPASYAAESTPSTDISTEIPTEVPTDISTANPDIKPQTVTSSTYKSLTSAQDPLAPQNLQVESVSHNMMKFKWDFRSDPDNNNIQIWDADTDGNLTWGNYWTRAVTKLTPETTYRIYITWNEDVKREHKSNVIEFTTTKDESEYKDAPLTPPSFLKIQEVTEDSVTLNWGSSPGAEAYDIYVNGAWKGGVWDSSVTTTTYGPLNVGETYTFKVGAQRSVDGAVDASANSNAVTIKWGELAQPKGLQKVTSTRSTVSLGWAPVPGATSYDIYQDGVKIGSSNESRFVVTALEEGKSYSYKVVGYNSLWTSPESESVSVVPGSNYNNVTYYTSWSASTTDRNLHPGDLNVSQLTHINYAFADICWKKYGSGSRACEDPTIPAQNRYVHDGEIVIGDTTFDFQNFKAFESVKASNPHLKLMVSVGGWTWSGNFSNIAMTEETRRAFANSAVNFLRNYNLDGLDVDWEYPVEGGDEKNSYSPKDKENFTLLMKAVREALDAAGSEDGKYYLLSIASWQSDKFIVNADIPNSVQYLDFVNIMTYDYSGKGDSLGHHNAPLFYDKNLTTSSAPRNHVLGGLLSHLNGGVPTYKLNAGVPYYGKGWDDCLPTGQYQACSGGTSLKTWEASLFDFSDLENNYIDKNGYKRYWNEAAKVPYLYNDQNKVFITYNDKNTMVYTASIVKSLDIAGVMSWDISGDRNLTLTSQLVKDLPINGKVNTSALGAPANLSLVSVGSSSLKVKWDAVDGATDYEVYVNNALSGSPKDNSYTINGLNASTDYKIHVLAVDRAGDEIHRVSNASNVLSAATSGVSSGGTDGESGGSSGSGGSGGSGSTGSPAPSTPQPPKAKDQLDVKVDLKGDKAVVSVPVVAAVNNINQSDFTNFQIHAGANAKQAEVEIPQEIIAALAKKGAEASLSILVNGTEYRIPASLIKDSGKVKVSIVAPGEADAASVTSLLKGKEALTSPLLFKLEQVNADKTTTELKHFGKSYVSEFVTVDAKKINTKHAFGVVYIPGTNELRSVPTLFKVNADGTVTVEIKKTGSGIYALIQQDIQFKDAIPSWAREDVAQAAAKLLVSGDNANIFGGNKHITRAEIISIVVKGLGILPDDGYANFKDVDAKTQYSREIAAAKAAGLVKGRSGDTFDPNTLITREELATILSNALEYAGKKNGANQGVLNKFKDNASVSSYAKSAVAFVVDQKILQGVSATKLDPQSNVTKAQTVVTVMRLLRAAGLSN
ncbi:glycoside hydrolase [Bacillus sp. FJAT-18019]|nr:glycoside hydrolase [Bacillus sp. FJAT-18019]